MGGGSGGIGVVVDEPFVYFCFLWKLSGQGTERHCKTNKWVDLNFSNVEKAIWQQFAIEEGLNEF